MTRRRKVPLLSLMERPRACSDLRIDRVDASLGQGGAVRVKEQDPAALGVQRLAEGSYELPGSWDRTSPGPGEADSSSASADTGREAAATNRPASRRARMESLKTMTLRY